MLLYMLGYKRVLRFSPNPKYVIKEKTQNRIAVYAHFQASVLFDIERRSILDRSKDMKWGLRLDY